MITVNSLHQDQGIMAAASTTTKMPQPYRTLPHGRADAGRGWICLALQSVEGQRVGGGFGRASLQETIEPGVLNVWSRRHNIKFAGDAKQGEKVAQFETTHNMAEVMKIYLKCFSAGMQQELKLWGKGEGADRWTRYAGKVFEVDKAVEKAEHYRRLFGMSEGRFAC